MITQDNAGAGTARNTGLGIARGEYLFFLDSDDFLDPYALEETYNKAVTDRAAICLFEAQNYDDKTGNISFAWWLLKTDLIHETIPFNSSQLGDNIFFFTNPAPWDKLFRKNFIQNNG